MLARVFLLALSLCAAACASSGGGSRDEDSAPDHAALVQRVRGGAITPSDYDFGAVKFHTRQGAEELDRLALSLSDPSMGEGALNNDCSVRHLRALEALPWLQLAMQANDYDGWSTDAAALRQRIAQLESEANAYGRGEPVTAPRADQSAAEAFRRRAVVAPDPRATDLFSRAARDQAMRSALQGTAWQADLPASAAAQWTALVSARTAVVDCANADWMSEQLQTLDWFDRQTYGPAADNAAWLIVLHADRSRGLQRDVLARLQRLAPQGRTDPANVAALAQRLASVERR